MSKKKSYSLDDLKKIKITDEGIKEKTSEEISKLEAEENRINTTQKNNIDVNHSIKIPDAVYENIQTRQRKINLEAFAPYNFIPLNDKVVPSDFEMNKVPFDKYHKEKKNGYIALNIQTKTPIYLRDLLEKDESEKVEQLKSEIENLKTNTIEFRRKYIELLELTKSFYSPGDGVFKLSGSSLRGMIRTHVEIISFSRIGFIDENRKFHYRSMADMSVNLKQKFSAEMLGGDRNSGFYQKVKAGYLVKDGNNFKIKPAISHDPNCQFYRVEEDLVISAGILTERMSIEENGRREENPSYKFGFKKIKFTSEPLAIHQHSQNLKYARVNRVFKVDDSNAPENANEGVLICTGWMRNQRIGKHLHWVIKPAENSDLEFLPGVVEDYKNDEGRVKGANLLEWFKEFNADQIPCFYLTEGDRVKSFGHTGIFRLAYEQSLKDFIPFYHRESKLIDITEGIFGNETEFAGRVFFEDAKFINSVKENPLIEKKHPQILSSPKPTTFQHYVVQKNIEPLYNENQRSRDYGKLQGLRMLKDYNSTDVALRGNKMYWHKENSNWAASQVDLDKHLKQLTLIECIDEGAKFNGRIRFENLSDVELGALLFTLDLPDGCCHKIGMGKPLGLGSIKITPTLHLSNRENRYTHIADEWSSELKESTSEDKNINNFKNVFENYILSQLKSDKKSLWEIERMEELQRMLDFNNKPALDKTRYMKIEPKPNEFRNRPVLPKPTDVK